MTKSGIHIFIGEYTHKHAHIAKEGGDDNTLNNDEFQYAPWLGANGFTDSELMGTLFNCDKHNVADTYDTTKQSKQSHNPECGMDDGNTLFHLHILSIAIPYPDGTFVFRMNLMVGIQSTAISILKRLVSLLGS